MHLLSKAILRRAAVVALIVGPVLTLINQGDAIFGAATFDPLRALLTSLVPFCVSLVSSLLAAREFARSLAIHEEAWTRDMRRLHDRIEELETRQEQPQRRGYG